MDIEYVKILFILASAIMMGSGVVNCSSKRLVDRLVGVVMFFIALMWIVRISS